MRRAEKGGLIRLDSGTTSGERGTRMSLRRRLAIAVAALPVSLVVLPMSAHADGLHGCQIAPGTEVATFTSATTSSGYITGAPLITGTTAFSVTGAGSNGTYTGMLQDSTAQGSARLIGRRCASERRHFHRSWHYPRLVVDRRVPRIGRDHRLQRLRDIPGDLHVKGDRRDLLALKGSSP